ncbi:MAG: hypothetical protein DA328_05270 [Nitrososphaeraceae archaeon]|nr:hypothetical protein [Nitrososphaeraceae archaeon]
MNAVFITKFYDYLRLIRFPNLLTVPSNVLVGYLILVTIDQYNLYHIATLIFSSLLLYISGIVFNDIFDLQTDRTERPKRPLPSGKVSKNSAYFISLGSMVGANLLVFVNVGFSSLLLTGTISVLILLYDLKIKKTYAGPIVMGLSRSFNILLGASPFLFYGFTSETSIQMISVFVIVFLYVFLITLISRNEINNLKSKIIIHFSFGSIFLIVVFILILILTGVFDLISIINVFFFWTVMIYLYLNMIFFSKSLQFLVTNMIISLILIDAVIISGLSNFVLSLFISLLCIPAIYLRKYFYVT